MYNHYTPQGDGSYRHSRIPDTDRRAPAPQMDIPVSSPESPRQHPPQNPTPPFCPPSVTAGGCSGILSFLQNLLPRQIDAADLLVILLVLLMNGDSRDRSCSPMLTLALYFLL